MSWAAETIVQARRLAGLTQAELARRTRLPRSVLNAYERGTRQPGANALASIISAAGFSLELESRIDLEANARALSEVLDLAERLPYRPKVRLRYPPLNRRAS